MLETCDLLVCSTDRFLPEARLTINQLKKLGFTELFDCHLLLGDLRPEIQGFNVLNRNRAGTWSSELREGLLQLEKPYVLLWLDDFIPVSSVPLLQLEALIRVHIQEGGNYLRLNPTPRGHGRKVREGVREVLSGEFYRTSTIMALWRREVLLELLDDRETAWQFELVGSARSAPYGGFAASDKQLVDCVNVVVKGLVDPRAESRLKAHGISLDTIDRRRMSSLELALLRFKEFRSALLMCMPWFLRGRIRNIFATDLKTVR